MAIIKPFKAIRPRVGEEGIVVTQPDDEIGVFDESESFKERYRDLLEQDDKESYYVYEQISTDGNQTGLVVCILIDNYIYKVVKKHEETIDKKEADCTKEVYSERLQRSPVFLVYKSDDCISTIIERIKKSGPLYDFEYRGILNRIWRVSKRDDVVKLTRCFIDINSLYIADGHHRCASAVKAGKQYREWIFRCGEAAYPEKWKPSVRRQETEIFVNAAEPPVRCSVSCQPGQV